MISKIKLRASEEAGAGDRATVRQGNGGMYTGSNSSLGAGVGEVATEGGLNVSAHVRGLYDDMAKRKAVGNSHTHANRCWPMCW